MLPLANSPGGHRLGVNGLAVDVDQSILYDRTPSVAVRETHLIESAGTPAVATVSFAPGISI